jgi:hypothetical protein
MKLVEMILEFGLWIMKLERILIEWEFLDVYYNELYTIYIYIYSTYIYNLLIVIRNFTWLLNFESTLYLL